MGDGNWWAPEVEAHAEQSNGPRLMTGPIESRLRGAYSATRSFRPFEAEKWAYLFAAIVIVSPVAGFLP